MIQVMQLGAVSPVKAVQAKPLEQSTPAELTQSFGQYLQNAINSVNTQEQAVSKLNDQYLVGNVDVTKVMIASQQAELTLQLTTEVRNKIIDAYQEIMRMQI
ncbi:flagellar hook-basal body complex protein FliE [Paenibacillus sp. HB172176]|uniref:flagellar hook-basal body complex protein FliE n=1 Tax=Paenibacillus sp. HB172176 TaxID=2493690 RepID=UPI0014391B43|nr:flagellar hook-basal body complex protein FliE [Paenibacillus sp. HB172176]